MEARGGVRWFLRSGLRWAILALLIVAFLWFVPQLQGENLPQKVPAEERAALVNEYRRTWAQIIGGFGLLLGLYFTWRRIEISQQELEATRDQQVTERFTRAIDQLGDTDNDGKNKKLEIRLGGIYALERIAVDSFSMENFPGRDYSTVMEVLTAYVRENTRQASEPSNGSSDETSMSNEATAEADEWAKQAALLEQPHPTADIQAILDVLRRTQDRVPEDEEYRTRLDLHEANLSGANLQRADLLQANLQRADLSGANLQRAYFQRANLQGAYLQRANLQRAYLREANLQRADLSGANLQRADLLQADLLQADLQGANLQGAALQEANLDGLTLQEADLRGAYLQEANLSGANLQRADLRGANLREAFFLEADLRGADLRGADLRGANLQGAYFPEAILQREQIERVIGDETTRLPDGLDRPVAWTKSVEEQQRERRPEIADVERLLEALDTDFEWVRFHTRLLRGAAEWDKGGRDSSFLLRGSDLMTAEMWQAKEAEKEPKLTSLQKEYILASRQAALRRQRKLLGATTLVLIVSMGLSVISFLLWASP